MGTSFVSGGIKNNHLAYTLSTIAIMLPPLRSIQIMFDFWDNSITGNYDRLCGSSASHTVGVSLDQSTCYRLCSLEAYDDGGPVCVGSSCTVHQSCPQALSIAGPIVPICYYDTTPVL